MFTSKRWMTGRIFGLETTDNFGILNISREDAQTILDDFADHEGFYVGMGTESGILVVGELMQKRGRCGHG